MTTYYWDIKFLSYKGKKHYFERIELKDYDKKSLATHVATLARNTIFGTFIVNH